MTARFDLYAASGLPLQGIVAKVSATLGVTFVPHESSFFGDYFLWHERYEKEIRIGENVPDEDGELLEAERPATETLVYASQLTEDQFEQIASISELTLIRSERI